VWLIPNSPALAALFTGLQLSAIQDNLPLGSKNFAHHSIKKIKFYTESFE
jgi:hypothetical protein